MIDDGLLDRAQGALVGVHTGDALGASVEFEDAVTIAREFPGGVRNATRTALSRLAQGVAPSQSGVSDEHTQANGSLRRIMPVVLANLDQPERMRTEAQAVGAITHAHPMCIAACDTYCELAALLIHGADPHAAVRLLSKRESNTSVRDALDDAVRCDAADQLAGPRGGYVLWSFRVAVWAVLHAPDVQEGLVAVIALGGDTDTNAAIAGGLLGARHGLNSIPERWRAALHLGAELELAAAALLERDSPTP